MNEDPINAAYPKAGERGSIYRTVMRWEVLPTKFAREEIVYMEHIDSGNISVRLMCSIEGLVDCVKRFGEGLEAVTHAAGASAESFLRWGDAIRQIPVLPDVYDGVDLGDECDCDDCVEREYLW